MNKQLKIVAIAVLILAIAAIFFINRTGTKETFKQVRLDSSNIVLNYTPQKYLDTIVLAGLSKYGLGDVVVSIYELPEDVKQKVSSDYELNANIRGKDGVYDIWINQDIDRRKAINVLSHELIHLLQYQDGRLVLKSNVPYWNGVMMPIETLDYESRPWEKEAITRGVDLEEYLLKLLY